MLIRTLAKKERFLFLPELLLGKDTPVLKTYKANHEQNRSHKRKPIKTTANRNASQKP